MSLRLTVTLESGNAAFATAQDATQEAERLLGLAARWAGSLGADDRREHELALRDANGNRVGRASLAWWCDESPEAGQVCPSCEEEHEGVTS